MSEIITEDIELGTPKATEQTWKTLLSFEINVEGQTRVQLMSKNEAHLALALRRMGQAVDQYLYEEDMKRIAEASRIVQAVVPQGVLDKLRG